MKGKTFEEMRDMDSESRHEYGECEQCQFWFKWPDLTRDSLGRKVCFPCRDFLKE